MSDWIADTACFFALPSTCQLMLQPDGQGTSAGKMGSAGPKVREPRRMTDVLAEESGCHCSHCCQSCQSVTAYPRAWINLAKSDWTVSIRCAMSCPSCLVSASRLPCKWLEFCIHVC